MQTEIEDALDESSVGRKQMILVSLSVMALVLDGLGLQLLGLLAPAILQDWGLSPAAIGPALAAALLGLCVGAVLGGRLGDLFGRKVVLVFSTTLFGSAIFCSGFASGVDILIALRLLEGLGFGAATPNGFALASEWMPRRLRSGVVGLLSMALPLGGLVGALLVLWLLPQAGWRGCFFISGTISLLLAIGMMFFLMESPGFLLRTNRASAAAALIHKVTGMIVPVKDIKAEPSAPKIVASIFTRENLRMNAGVWLTYFSLSFLGYSIASWGTVALTMGGTSLSSALTAATAYNLMAVTSAALLGFEIALLGSRRCIVIGSAGAIAALVAILLVQQISQQAVLPPSSVGIIIAMAALGGFSGLVGSTSNALMTNGYPIDTRASGIGYGIMSGRLGGLVASSVGGVILSLRGDDTTPFFLLSALIMLFAIAGALIINRHIPSGWRLISGGAKSKASGNSAGEL